MIKILNFKEGGEGPLYSIFFSILFQFSTNIRINMFYAKFHQNQGDGEK